MKKATLLLAVVAMLTGVAGASVVFYEPFDYPVGELNGQGGDELGFAAGSTYGNKNEIGRVVEGSLSYDGITFEGGTPFTPVGNREENGYHRYGDLTRSVNDTVADLMDFGKDRTFYVSMLVERHAWGPQNRWVFGTEGGSFFGIGLFSDLWLYMPKDSGFPSYTKICSSPAYNQPYFIVIKVETSATGDDIGYVAVYTTGDTVPADEPTTWTKTLTTNCSKAVINFLLHVDRNDLPANLGAGDEIRVGESWQDVTVVPEPATLVLLGLGGCLALLRRKK